MSIKLFGARLYKARLYDSDLLNGFEILGDILIEVAEGGLNFINNIITVIVEGLASAVSYPPGPGGTGGGGGGSRFTPAEWEQLRDLAKQDIGKIINKYFNKDLNEIVEIDVTGMDEQDLLDVQDMLEIYFLWRTGRYG
jgi:hypothetical protein